MGAFLHFPVSAYKLQQKIKAKIAKIFKVKDNVIKLTRNAMATTLVPPTVDKYPA